VSRLLTLAASSDPRLVVTTPTDEYVMTVGLAAKRLGVSPGYLSHFDAELRPMRDRFRRRLYRPADVERVAAERAAKQGGSPPTSPTSAP